MTKILIIKLGALGDVVRTTSLLRALPSSVTWVTDATAVPLLNRIPNLEVIPFQESEAKLLGTRFDVAVSLDDEPRAARLAAMVKADEIVGTYMADNEVKYTDSSRAWFDMSLLSKFGRKAADSLKMANRKSYQEIIFPIATGKPFQKEEYVINSPATAARQKVLVGIEARAGDRWPMKKWDKYSLLSDNLSKMGFETVFLQQRDRLEEYIQDISMCTVLVCGDTLAMHLALGLCKLVVALFICTSPHEIYEYGRLTKIVSPMLEEHFYKREFIPAGPAAISKDVVLSAVLEQLKAR